MKDDFGPDIEDETTRITLIDRLDMAREWVKHNITERAVGTYRSLHYSAVKNRAANWERVYRFGRWFLLAGVIYLSGVVGYGLKTGQDFRYYALFMTWVGTPLVLVAVGVNMARVRGYVPAHQRLWVANMFRLHIHTGRCNHETGRHQLPGRHARPEEPQ